MASYSLIVAIISFCFFFHAESVQSNPLTSNVAANKQSKLNVDQVNVSAVDVQDSSLSQAVPISTCVCGVFLTDQFVKGSSKPPTGYPPISKDIDDDITCNASGVKQCTAACVKNLITFLPESGDLICASIDRDCFKQRAYLFVNNCNKGWINTKYSAGPQYCCKNGKKYNCSFGTS